MSVITIKSGNVSIQAELLENETAKAIEADLPISGIVNTWGEEIYFDIPVSVDLDENAQAEVEIGDLGYWPPGKAFCIFFGKTPMSTNDKPQAASPVNIFGKLIGDIKSLKSIPRSAKIFIELAT